MSIHPKIKIHMSIIVSFQYLVKGNTVSHYCLYCIRISKRLEMYPQMKIFECYFTYSFFNWSDFSACFSYLSLDDVCDFLSTLKYNT